MKRSKFMEFLCHHFEGILGLRAERNTRRFEEAGRRFGARMDETFKRIDDSCERASKRCEAVHAAGAPQD